MITILSQEKENKLHMEHKKADHKRAIKSLIHDMFWKKFPSKQVKSTKVFVTR